MQDPAAVYDIEKFSYIITVGHRLGYFLVSPEGPYQSVADLQGGKDLKIGGSTASGYISLGSLTVIKLLGLDAKVITGIDSESDRALAVKRGEIIGYFESIATARAGLIAGLVKPMFVVATERDPLMPDVPAITELVNLTDEDLALVKLWETTFASSTLLAASPGTPEDRLAFLRGLVNKWVQDEGFREEISAVSGYDLREEEYITGEEVTQEMLDTAGALDEFQTIFAELIEKYRA
jgi:tripartite-type tricarboxylate transporter receptor subunit TctC